MVKEGEGEGEGTKGIIRTFFDIDEHKVSLAGGREISLGFSAYFRFNIMGPGGVTVILSSPRVQIGPCLDKESLRQKMIEFAVDFEKLWGESGISSPGFVESIKKIVF